ncbi:MAG TPA: methyltransferase domain-containing protein [Gammaproteobacteria bacterium]|nr:methyltransferase domain-containing protein [Gammaproteobacteria bacterium]
MHWLDNATLAKRATAEARALAPFVGTWGGRLAVQVGTPSVAFASPDKFARCIVVSRDEAAAVRARAEALPLAEDSVDVLFLIHVLEETRHPAAVLAEAARVLRGEGRVVVVGFRPLPPTLLRQLPRRIFRSPPRALGLFRLRLLLGRAGLAFERAPGLGGGPIVRHLPGQWQQVFAGSYAVIGRKKIHGMTVLRPSWKRVARKRRQAVLSGHGRAG